MVGKETQLASCCEKQIDSKGNNVESGVSSKKGESSNQFPAILDGLARNKPILDVLSVACLILILAIIGVIVCLVVLYGNPFANTGNRDSYAEENPARFVTRDEWHARPPKERLDLLQRPVRKIIVAHTATEGCTTKIDCVDIVRRIQDIDMDPSQRYFFDIGYNFLVGADGNIYEGRGWDHQGAHTNGFNKESIGIAFIGTFTDVDAPESQLDAARRLIALGVQYGMIDQNYRLYGQRQLIPLESPGRKLYEQIKAWPNWSNQLDGNP